jgi:anthranilate phosphoribosyltransferase
MRRVLERVLHREDLSEEEADRLLVHLTRTDLPPAWAGAILAALRSKGETPRELRGFATAMRRLARRPAIPQHANLVDIVGTGGDGSGSLNLSTGSALLAAAAGLSVVKHGNRSVSSRSGSADVLAALGVDPEIDDDTVSALLDATGFTFLFAPLYHPAMAAVARVRRQLRTRTIFNVLGPLVNPAEPPFLLAGAYAPEAAERMARALSGMGLERAFVVHGEPGWDEPTPVGPFLLFDVRPGRVSRREEDPASYGIPRCRPEALAGGDAAENAERLRAALGGERGPHRDALVLGAALALRLTGRARGASEAASAAAGAIEDGRAAGLLSRLPEVVRARRWDDRRKAGGSRV